MVFGLLYPYSGENNLICLLTSFLISLWSTTKLMQFFMAWDSGKCGLIWNNGINEHFVAVVKLYTLMLMLTFIITL